jgi:hypothetical protein
MHPRTFTIAAIALLSLAQFATAGDYLITWKSALPEGTMNRCDIKITGSPAVGASTPLKNWEGVSFPLYAFIPNDFNKKISYSPVSGCARLNLDIYCHSKPDGGEWRQGLTINPCQDRTIRVYEYGVRLE